MGDRDRDLSNAVLFSPLPFCSFVQMSQRVHLVLSVSGDSGLGETLQQSQGAYVVALGSLVPSSRAQLVREELALYGKRLEESPFNNQVGPRPGLVGMWGASGSYDDAAAEATSCHPSTAFWISPELSARGSCS